MNKLKPVTLILDDDPSYTKMAKRALESFGHTVSSASSLIEAQTAIKSVIPHLILLDVHFKDKDCFELLEETMPWIKKSGIKVFITSQTATKTIVSKALSLGVDDYIFKPLNTSVLLKKIKIHLDEDDYLKYEFKKPIHTTAKIKSEITQFNDEQLCIEGPFKASLNTKMSLSSRFLNKLNSKSIQFIASGKTYYTDDQVFLNYINILGTNPDFYREIQKYKKIRAS